MKIIPAIDILDGKCVRLKQGNYSDQKIYSTSPIKVAKQFEKEAAYMIHIVDLDGAKTGSQRNFEIISEIAKSIKTPIEVGGGIRNEEVIYKLLNSGVSRIILGTVALENVEFVKKMINKFGSERIVVGIDAKKGLVAIKGWKEITEIKALDFIKNLEEIGVKTIIYTDIETDGMMEGPNIKEIKKVMKNFNGEIIASGGISSYQDIKKLNKINIQYAIIGKAIYEGEIKFSELRNKLTNH